MSGLVIFFAVMHRGDTVGVCGKIVEFRGSLVRILWHTGPLNIAICEGETFESSSRY